MNRKLIATIALGALLHAGLSIAHAEENTISAVEQISTKKKEESQCRFLEKTTPPKKAPPPKITDPERHKPSGPTSIFNNQSIIFCSYDANTAAFSIPNRDCLKDSCPPIQDPKSKPKSEPEQKPHTSTTGKSNPETSSNTNQNNAQSQDKIKVKILNILEAEVSTSRIFVATLFFIFIIILALILKPKESKSNEASLNGSKEKLWDNVPYWGKVSIIAIIAITITWIAVGFYAKNRADIISEYVVNISEKPTESISIENFDELRRDIKNEVSSINNQIKAREFTSPFECFKLNYEILVVLAFLSAGTPLTLFYVFKTKNEHLTEKLKLRDEIINLRDEIINPLNEKLEIFCQEASLHIESIEHITGNYNEIKNIYKSIKIMLECLLIAHGINPSTLVSDKNSNRDNIELDHLHFIINEILHTRRTRDFNQTNSHIPIYTLQKTYENLVN